MIKTDDIRMMTLVPGQAISISVPWQDDIRVNVLVIYAPNALREIEEFWETITDEIH